MQYVMLEVLEPGSMCSLTESALQVARSLLQNASACFGYLHSFNALGLIGLEVCARCRGWQGIESENRD